MDLRPAIPAEIEALWPAARAAHLFPDRAAFARFHAEAPWRVRIGVRGSAAVLERWRDHLDILSIRALWLPERDVPPALASIRALARAQGFGRVLSPLLPVEAIGPYLRSGLAEVERIVNLRADSKALLSLGRALPPGVGLRPASPADVSALDRLDRECFEPFWAYGARRLEISISSERVLLAEESGRVIGYTLSTVERGSGTLGRLAVAPGARGLGIGTALFAEAAGAMARSGAATVNLCTQEGNEAARRLYARLGMRELPGRLVFLLGSAAGAGNGPEASGRAGE